VLLLLIKLAFVLYLFYSVLWPKAKTLY